MRSWIFTVLFSFLVFLPGLVQAQCTLTATATNPTCQNPTITLTASGGGPTYSWTGPNGYNKPNATAVQTIPNATGVMGGTYQVISAGCTATVNVTVPFFGILRFKETIGTASSGSVATHEANNSFDNDGLTMTATGGTEIRTTNASSGYPGASGAANVLFSYTQEKTFTISGINNAQGSYYLSFGFSKSTNDANGNNFEVEYSADNGFSWVNMPFPVQPNGAGTATWRLITMPQALPNSANLRIRFTHTPGSLINDYRIDDIKMINAAVFAPGGTTICSGTPITLTSSLGNSYSWSPGGQTTQSISVNQPGNYTVTVSNGSGCTVTSDPITVIAIANPQPATPDYDKPLCVGGILTLLAPPPGGGASYYWTGPNGFKASFQNPTVTTNAQAIHSGTYYLTTIVKGCSSAAAPLVVTVNPVPPKPTIVSPTGSPILACAGDTAVITAAINPSQPNVVFEWFTQPFGGVPVFTGNPFKVFVASGSQTFYVGASAGGCQSTSRQFLEIQSHPKVLANAGPDQPSICTGNSTTLSANPAINPADGGQWSIVPGTTGGSFSSATSPTATFTGTPGITYQLVWSITNPPCPISRDTVLIYFNTNVQANAGPDQLTVCTPSATLAGNTPPPGAGTWTASPAGGTFSNPNSPTSTFTGTPGTLYTLTWTISNVCGNSSDQMQVQFQPSAVAQAGPDQLAICGTLTTQLAANDPSPLTGQWTITGGTGGTIANPGSPTSGFTGLVSVTYTLRWTVAGGGTCPNATDDVQIRFTPTPAANAGPDQLGICGTLTATLAAANPAPGTGQWTISSGTGGSLANANQHNTTFTGVAGTTYTLTWTTTTTGCPASTDDVQIKFNTAPTADAGPDQNLCGVTTTTLAATAPASGTGQWTIVSGTGGNIANPASPTSGFSGTAGQTYVLRWTVSNAPCTDATDNVSITFTPNPTTSAGPDQLGICGTLTAQLAATPAPAGTTGQWSIVTGTGGTIANPASATSNFTGTAGTQYTLLWTITSPGCADATDEVEIKFNSSPTATAGPDQLGLCGVTTTTLAATAVTPPATGQWTITSGTGGILANPASPTSGFTGTAGVTYTLTWTVTSAGCPTATDAVQVQFTPAPAANAGPDQLGLCGTTTATLAATAAPAGGSGQWTVTTGTGGTFANATSATTAFTGITGVAYTLRWTVTSPGCPTDFDEVAIQFNSAPVADAGPDQLGLCGITSTTLAGSAPAPGTGQWTIVSGTGGAIATPSSPTSAFTGTAGQTYVLRWSVTNAPCPVSSDEVSIQFTPAPAANAGPDQLTICGTSATLAASAVPAGGTGTWSVISGTGGTFANATSPTSTFSGTLGTTYTLEWTVTSGSCPDATDQVEVKFNAAPTATAGPDQALCGATSATLAANNPAPATGTWSIVSGTGGTFTNATSPTSGFTGTAGTTYVLRWTVDGAPCPDAQDEVQIQFTPSPTASAGPDQLGICGTTTATLSGSAVPAGGTGQWSVVTGTGGTFSNAASPTSTFTGTAGIAYTLEWNITSPGCPPASDQVQVQFNAAPTATAGPDQSLCGTTTTTLAANTPAAGTGQWAVVTGTGGTFANASSPSSSFTGTSGVTYTLRWTVTNAPCTAAQDEVQIAFTPTPTASAGPDQLGICGTTSATLAATPAPAGSTGTWTITSGTGGNLASATSPTSTFTGTVGQTYTLTWTITNSSCPDATDDVQIQFNAAPVADAGPDQLGLCGVTSTTLAANAATPGTGQWSVVSGTGGTFSNVTSPASTFTGTTGTVYVLRWTITNAPCPPSTDEVSVQFNSAPAAQAGPDQLSICGTTTATLAATNPAPGTGQWTVVTGTGGTFANANQFNTTFTGTAGTIYTLEWTVTSAGCPDATDQVQVKFNPASVATAGPDQTLCGVTTITLAANNPAPGTGQWTITSGTGGTFANAASPTTTFTGTSGQTYTLLWTVTNGSCPDATDDVQVQFSPTPTTSAGPDQLGICTGTTTTLAATAAPAGGTGTWSVITGTGGTFSSTTSPTATFTGTAGQTYTLRWTVTSASCPDASDEVQIGFNSAPTATAGPDQLGLCGVTTTTLAGSNPAPGTGQWTVVTGTGGTFANATSPTSGFTGTAGQAYTLRWTVTNTPCPAASDEVQVQFNSAPLATAGPDQTGICGTTTATLAAHNPAPGTGQWTVVTGTGGTFANAAQFNTTFTGTAGTAYTLQWTVTSAGCPTVNDQVQIQFTPSPTATAGPDQTVCGATTVTLAANSPAPATGAWTIVSGTGGTFASNTSPTSTFTGTLGQTYVLRWTVTSGACPDATDEVQIQLSPTPTTSAGPDQSICATSATLAATAAPSGATGTWTVVSGTGGTFANATSPTTTFSGTTGTAYTLRWTVTSPGCPVATDQVDINFGTVAIADAGPDQALCGATSTTLAANTNSPTTGAWTITSGTGGTIANPASPTSSFTGTSGQTYVLTWTLTPAGCPVSTDDVQVQFSPTPTTSAGPDQLGICTGTTATLAATAAPSGATGTWTVVSGTGGTFANATSPTTTFSGTTGTAYTLRWTVTSSACPDAQDEVQISFGTGATATAGPDQSLCGTTSATLAGNTPASGTGQWTVVSGTGGTFANSTSPTTSFTGTSGQTYVLRWTVTNAPCPPAQDEVQISFTPTPTTSAGPDQLGICTGTTATLAATPAPAGGTGTWSVVTGTGGTFSSTASPTATFTGTVGSYTLRWTVTSTGCPDASDEVQIQFNSSPTAAAGPDQSVCGTTATLAATAPTSGTGIWTITSGTGGTIATPSSPASGFTGTAGTTYTLTWTVTSAGCPDATDDVQVQFTPTPTTSAGPDQLGICTGTTATLAATAAPSGATGTWTVVTGTGGTFANATSPTTTFTGTTGTAYTLRWAVTAPGCPPAQDEVDISFGTGATADAGPDQLGICGTLTTNLAATAVVAPATGAWTIVSGTGGTLANPASPTSGFTGTAGTAYTLRWTVTNSPCPPATDEVDISFNAAPTATAGPDQTGICGTTTATLSGSNPAPGTGQWTIVSGTGGTFANASQFNSAFTGTAGQTYVLRWTVSSTGCPDASDEVSIGFIAAPAANAGPDQLGICGTTTATLAATAPTAPATGQWTVVTGAGGTFSNASSATSTFTGTAGVTYTLRWTITNSTCPNAQDEVDIQFNTSPLADAGPDQTGICGTTATLAANNPAPGTGAWTVVSGVGGTFSSTTSPTATFTGTAGTAYTLQWTVTSAGCPTVDDQVAIQFTTTPAADAGPDQLGICGTLTTSLAAVAPATGTGAWSIVSGTGGTIATPSSATSSFTGVVGQTYVLRWTVTNASCPTSTDEVSIQFNATPTATAGPDQLAICGTTTATLAGNNPAPGTGTWTVVTGTGGTFTNASQFNTTFTGTAGAPYTLRWTVTSTGCPDASDEVQIQFNSSPTAAAGPDQSVCGTTATLAATAPTSGTGTWTITSGTGGTIATPSSPASGFTGTAGTTYTLTWTVTSAGCPDATDDVQVQFTPTPTTSAGPDQLGICTGTTATLAATAAPSGATGTWTVVTGTGGTFSSTTSPTATFTGTVGSSYSLRWTVTSTGCPDASDEVQISFGTGATADAGPDQLGICGTLTTNLAATAVVAPATGAWTIVSGTGGTFANASSATSTFSGTAGQTYVLRWTVTNAPCAPATDEVTIEFSTSPVAQAGPDQLTICGTSATLAATAPGSGSGQWSIVSGTGGTIANPASATSTFTGTVGTLYTLRWTVSSTGCPDATDEVDIQFNSAPTVSAGPDQPGICGSTTASLAGSAVPAGGSGQWTVISGTGGTFSNAASANATFTGTVGTSYTLEWSVTSPGCPAASDQVSISFGTSPVADAGTDQSVCGTTATLAATPVTAPATGTWTIISGTGGSFANATSATSAFTGTAGTTYVLRWTVSSGSCPDASDEVTVAFSTTPTTSAGPDQNICSTTATLAATPAPGGATGTWTIVTGTGGTFSSTTTPTATFTGTAGTTYTLEWTVTSPGCPDAADQVEIVFGTGAVAAAGPDQLGICGTSATLAATPAAAPATGVWTITSGTGGTIATPASPTSAFTGTAGSTYTLEWTVTSPGCTPATDQVQVSFGTTPVATAGPDQLSICAASATLAATPAPSGSTGTWTIVSGTGGVIANPASPTSGFTGTAGVVYTLRWTVSATGCPDATDEVDISFNSTVTADAGSDQSVCGTSATLAATAPASGTGQWTITSGTGGTITAPSSPTSSFTGTAGTTYVLTWTVTSGSCPATSDDVQVEFTPTPTTSAGPDQLGICGTTATLAAQAAPGGSTGSWTVVTGTGGTFANATSPTTTFTGTTGTAYTLRWTVTSAGCPDAQDEVDISFGNTLTAAAGPDQLGICSSTSTTLAATAPVSPATGNWSIVSGTGGTIANPSSPTSGFSGTVGQTYVLRWTVTSGSCPSATDEASIEFTPTPTTSAGPDQLGICGTTTAILAATPAPGAAAGTWTVVTGTGGTFSSTTTPTATFTGTAGTTYTLEWTVTSASCPDAADQVQIGFNNAPTASAGPDQTLSCATSATLAAQPAPGGSTGTWTIVSGTGGTITTPASATSTFTGTAGTTYVLRWTVTNPSCPDAFDEVSISFGTALAADAGTDQSVCGTTATLAAAPVTSPATGTWTIVSGTGGSFANAALATSAFTGTAGTTYVLRWTVTSASCPDATDEVTVDFSTTPTTSAGPDQSICGTTTATLAATAATSPASGAWTVVSGTGGTFANAASATTSFSGTAGQTYVLEWTVTSPGCPDASDQVQVQFTSTPTTAAGPDQTVCTTTATLAATPAPVGATGTWTVVTGTGGTFSGTTSPTAIFTGTTGVTYTLQWTVTSPGCPDATDQVEISFGSGATADAGTDQLGICGTTATLAAAAVTSPATGQWTITAGTGGTLTNASLPTSGFTGTSGTTYTLTWTVTSPGCAPSTDQVQISFGTTPTTSAGPDQTGICGTTATLAAQAAPIGSAGAWTVVTGTGGTITTPASPTSTFSGTAGTTYTLRWTVSSTGCPDATDEVDIGFGTAPSAVAGTDQNNCGTSATLAATAVTSPATGTWTIVSGTGGTLLNATSPTSGFTGTAGTVYVLRWTVSSAGCPDATDEVTIEFSTSPTTSAGPDQNICNTTATLAATPASGGATGQWTIVSGTGGTFANATLATTTFTGTTGTTYVLVWTVTSPGCPDATDQVEIIFGTGAVAAAGPDQLGICSSNATSLAATPVTAPATGVWTIVSGTGGTLSNPSSPTSTFTGTAGTVFTLEWTVTSPGCTPSTDQVQIGFKSTIIADAGTDQLGICGTLTTTLTAAAPAPGTGQWTISSGTGGTFSNPTSPTSSFTGIAGQTYTLTWTVTDASCSAASDDVQVEFTPTPTTSAGPDQTGICGATATLAAQAAPGGSTGAWIVVTGAGGTFANAALPTTTFTGAVGTTYTLRWTVTSPICPEASDEVNISFSPSLTAAAGPDQSICGTTSATLAATAPISGTGLWTITSGTGGTIATPSSATSTFTGTTGTVYVLEWTVSATGCTDATDQVEISFNNSPTTSAGADQLGICGTTTATLAATPAPVGGTGAWTVVTGTGGTFANASSPTSTFTGTLGQTYTLRWTVTTPGCPDATDELDIQFNTTPSTNAGPDQTLSCATSATLAAQPAPGGSTGTWTIVSGTGGTITTPASATSTFTGTAGTTYVLRWTVTNPSCPDAFDEVSISFGTALAADAGTDQSVCGTTATLAAAPVTSPATGTWTIVSGTGGSFANAALATSAFTGTAGTTYVLRWTVTSASCPDATDEVTVDFSTTPTTSAGPDQSICGTTTATLAATAATSPASGAWTVVSGTGGTFANAASATTSFSGTAGQTYVLEWTVTSPGCPDASDQVQVQFTSTPTTAAGPDQTVCTTTATLAATPAPVGATGTWTVVTGTGGTFSGTTSPTAIFTGTTGVTYTLQWTVTSPGCPDATDQVEISFGSGATADAGTDQLGICGTTATLAAAAVTSPATGQWTITAGTGGTIATPTSATSSFTGVAGQTYILTWTVTAPGCPAASDDVQVQFTPTPTTSAGPDQTGICGTTATLAAQAAPSGSAGAWTVVTGAGGTFANATSPTTTFTGTTGTAYTLRWTVTSASCPAATDEVNISFSTTPTVSAGPDQLTLCGSTTATLAASPAIAPATGQWTVVTGTGGTFSNATSPTSTFSGTIGVLYTLRWTVTAAGCPPVQDEVDIQFNAAPVAQAGPDQLGLCGTSTATMAANNPAPGTGQWTIVSGAGGTFANATSPTTTFTGTSGVLYKLRWTVSTVGCSSASDEAEVQFGSAFASAGPDQSICGTTTATLAANIPGSGSGSWSILSGTGGTIATTSSPTSTFTGTLGQTYELIWTVTAAGCPAAADTVQIQFTTTPTTSAGPDQLGLCGTTTATLAATPAPNGSTGTWTVVTGTGGTFGNATLAGSTFTGTAGTLYTLRWTVTNPSCPTATDDVQIQFTPGLVAAAGPDQLGQCNPTTNLAATAPISPVTGTWTIVSGTGGAIANPALATSSFTGTVGQTYVLRWTVSSTSCPPASDEVTIELVAPPVASAGTDQNGICGTSATLNATPAPIGSTGTWTIVSGTGGSIVAPGSPISSFNGAAGQNYVLRWTLTSANCPASFDEVNIGFIAPVTAAAGPDQTALCGVTSTTLAATPAPPGATGTWTIVSGAGGNLVNASLPASGFSGTPGTLYTLSWTVNKPGCPAATDSMQVKFNPAVTAAAGTDQLGICGTTATLAANNPAPATGQWTIVSGTGGTFSSTTSPVAGFTGTAGTAYVLRWTITNGVCPASSDDVSVSFQPNITAAAGPDQLTLCGTTTTTLAANAVTAPATGQWTVVTGTGGTFTNANSPTTSFSGTAGVLYTLRWSVAAGGCPPVTDEVQIRFNSAAVAQAGPDQLGQCGPAVTLAANTPATGGSGSWSIVSGAGGTFANAGSPASSFTGTAGTTYVLRWTVTQPPCGTDTDDLTVSFTGSATANAGPNQNNLCGVTSTTLAASTPPSGFTGTWSIVSGTGGAFANPGLPATTFSGTAGQLYILRWSVSNGTCPSATDQVQIRFNAAAEAEAGADQLNICDVTTAQLSAVAPAAGTGTWSLVPGTSGGSFSAVTSPTSSFSGQQGQTYQLVWTVTLPPCSPARDTVVVQFVPDLAAPTTQGGSVCGSGPVTLQATGGTNGNYRWYTSATATLPINGAVSGTFTTPVLNTSATYYVAVVSGTCESPRTPVIATVLQDPQANAGEDVAIFEGETVQLNGSGFGTFKWTPAAGLNNPNIATPLVKPEVTTTYVLTVTNANGCVASDTVVVTVKVLLIIPDAFTPNDDGVNDTWEIESISKFPNALVEIYDRWGAKVFSSRGYPQPWNGRLNGDPLPVATYYYIIDPGNGEDPKAGSITIIR